MTAVILVPLVIMAVLKLDSSEFLLVMMPVLAISSWEYSSLIKMRRWLAKALYVSALMGAAYFLNQTPFLLMPLLIVTLLWWVINSFWIISFPRHTHYWNRYLATRLVNGFFFFVPLIVSLSALHQIDSTLVLLLLVLIWAADSGAYFVGRTIGKNKLLPNVSPGKTIEGVAGGALLSLGIMSVYVLFVLENAAFEQYFFYGFLSLLVTLTSILGDLFESLYKRVAGVKDSGVLLPGHGGLFDRIDSLTASAPIFFLAYGFLT
ncbi:MAG: phosphatidate cytidylyltransferase [SAR324 cluster bacterium]|nr:phosphatidate cytidylyltransferase [SAR324 cluster bacterium]